MRGSVLGYEASTGQGVITGPDGQRVKFDRDAWKSPGEPVPGKPVDFDLRDDKAADIYMIGGGGGALNAGDQDPAKQALTAGIISLVCAVVTVPLGPFGIVTVVLAVIFGMKGKHLGQDLEDKTGYYLSIAGLIIAALMLLIVIATLTACAGFLGTLGGLGALS